MDLDVSRGFKSIVVLLVDKNAYNFLFFFC